jgi:hypothetical protein
MKGWQNDDFNSRKNSKKNWNGAIENAGTGQLALATKRFGCTLRAIRWQRYAKSVAVSGQA